MPASVVMMPECGVDAAHAAVEPVGGIDIAGAVDDDAVGLVERRRDGRAAVAGIAGIAGAGDRRDDPGRGLDAADAVVERVREIQIAGAVERDVERAVQQRLARRSAIPGEPLLAGADCGRDDPIWHF